MTAALWPRLAEIVPTALDLAPDARGPYLERACTRDDGTRDPDLLAEAQALLTAAADADRDGSLVSPVERPAARRTALPERVGPWRVTGLLGEGGMGVVYAAERAGDGFVQRAALKRVRAGTDGAGFRARFLRERGLLARLDHAGIARLLDGGVDDDGAPYLAVERVDGVPITEAPQDTLAERLGLFAEACDAVAYAHRNLVVHRDLKPAHILVVDGGPARVKLLDFGIATLLDANPESDAERTQTGDRMLTPQYAAPEQLLGQPVTTATDVYGLGLVLYEMLAGQRPYTLAGLTATQAERTVCETPIRAPSAMAPHAARALRGDLDTVCLKALARAPDRRYASAEALGADVRRHLAGMPVEARPDTVAYRTTTFLRRHRTLATATATAAVVLVAVVAAFTVRLSAERDRARDEAATSAAVVGFLRSTFAQASPAVGAAGRPSEIRLTDALQAALAGADTAFADRPEVRAAVLETLGRALLDLGLYDAAAPPLREALALRDRLHRAPHPDQVESLDALALLAMWRPDLGDADALFERSLALRRQIYGPESAEAAVGMANLAEQWVEREQYGRALGVLSQARAVVAAGPGEGSVSGGEVLFVYAVASLRAGHLADADAAFTDLLRFARRLVAEGAVAPDDDRIATILVGLGQTRMLLGHRAEAQAFLSEALARRTARYDAGSPTLAEAQMLYATALLDAGRAAEAEPLLRAALPGLADGDPYTEQRHIARIELARAESALGAAPGTDPLQADVSAIAARLGPNHAWTRLARLHVAALGGDAGTGPSARRPFEM